MIGAWRSDRAARVRDPGPSVAALLLATLAVTALIALWLHSVREHVAGPETVRIFLSLLLFQDYPAALWMLALAPLALLRPLQVAGMKLVRAAGSHPGWLAAGTAAVLALASPLVYHSHPLAMDEYAALFQSQVFAAGHLSGQFPPALVDRLVPPGFQGHFLGVSHASGAVASMYWPGFALLLAPFTRLGLTWLANPLLGGLTVVLVHRLALRLTENRDAAGLAALLTVASPAVTVNAISLYSMPAHLACNVGYVLLLLRPTIGRALLAGLVGSVALVLHNPVPHMLVAAPWLLWLCGQRDRLRLLAAVGLGYLPLCVLLGLGWWYYLGQLTATAAGPAAAALSTGAGPGWVDRLAGLDVFRLPGLDTLEDRVFALAKLWLWAVPGLILLGVAGVRRSGGDVRVRLLAWSALATLLGFLFVPVDQGHGWGFRYFHAAWFTLPVLAVAALWPTEQSPRQAGGPLAPWPRLAGPVAASAVLSLVVLTGLRAVQVEQFVARQVAQIPVAPGGSDLVVVRPHRGYYAADLVQNDPFLRARPIVLWASDDELDAILSEPRFAGLRLAAETRVASAWRRAGD